MGRRQQQLHAQRGVWQWRDGFNLRRILSSHRRSYKLLIMSLAFIALVPPIFFHFRLKRFHQMHLRKCSWLNNPPLVCAHGGDSTKAFPNTMAAYLIALRSQVDCIEVDVSRSADGVLFALHDRDLQRMSGNSTIRVGHLSMGELISNSVRQVILDAKVGPPSFEKGLAKDILSIVKRTGCRNCLVWAKSDNLARDMIKLSADVMVGYIVMRDPSTGARSNLLRMKNAGVVGVYHPLVDEKLVRILHGRNKMVYAWTVDDVDSMQKMLFQHVDAVVTSNPSLFQSLMQDMRTQCLEEGFSVS
ncbi:glycerophosphodiester phosphodiesterase GDPD4 isoform X2 [Malania oleifera]|uniref:glycerophosphodiester phosphodiesterase GDPD4 isoform X2 n=1 Tax=Malania oleifera TaxID=397392 RepID=UPI0025AEA060|nr:glycerophosphodiester phosphodiesterase GDPD4 isoform X2 [Malania oleifera]